MKQLSNELLAMVIKKLAEQASTRGDDAPQLVRSLISQSHKPSLAPFAIVSQKWQAMVEVHTMARIEIKSSELGKFAAVFKDRYRRSLLKHLDFRIELPTDGDSITDHVANCAAFEKEVVNLFVLLSAWEKEDQKSIGPLDLHLSAIWANGVFDNGGPTFFQVQLSNVCRRYLTLSVARDGLYPLHLPALQSVVALTITSMPGRALHPSAACALIAAAPGLRSLDLKIYEIIDHRVDVCSQHRIILAAGLLSALRNAPSQLRLTLRHSSTVFQGTEVANPEKDGLNELCMALSLLCAEGKLSELTLEDLPVSEELFRCSEGETWPALRRFHIRTGLKAANGGWWYGDFADPSESDEWLTMVDPAAFNRFMEAAAGATMRMPKLECACIEFTTRHWPYRPELDTIMQWANTGVELLMQPPETDSPQDLAEKRCLVTVGSAVGWEVPASLKRLWKDWLGDEGTLVVHVMETRSQV